MPKEGGVNMGYKNLNHFMFSLFFLGIYDKMFCGGNVHG
jgi:hypothetical protein